MKLRGGQGSSDKGRRRPARLPWGRKFLFALLPCVVLFALAEGTLSLLGYEGTTLADLQATVGFYEGAYVWRRDRVEGDWFIRERDGNGEIMVRSNPRLLLRGMQDERFPLEAGQQLRVFAVGGSTVQGAPYEHEERGFPQRLQGLLESRHPDLAFRFINAGVGGLDSRSLPDMTRQILELNADALIVYTGNNELAGKLLYDCSQPRREGLERWLNRVRLIRAGRSMWLKYHGAPAMLGAQGLGRNQDDCMKQQIREQWARQAALSSDSTMAGTPQGSSEPWMPAFPARTDMDYLQVLQDFKSNLESLSELAGDAGVPVWIALPAVNYLAEPVFPLPDPRLTGAERGRLDHLLQVARAASDVPGAKRTLERAQRLDPTHAEVAYRLGRLYLEEGRAEDARELLQLAVDRDYKGNRITSHMSALIEGICRDFPGVRCVDVQGAFQRISPQGIPGDDLFVDF